jgi:tRNA pseudouridine65 synthase
MAETIAGLPILHEEEGWFALQKPSGLPVHRGYTGERRTLVELLKRAGMAAVHPVHRLDRGTSGVLLVARTAEATRALQSCFTEHRVEKRYVALARGVVPEDQWIEYAIPNGPERDAPRVEARTRVRRLAMLRLDASPLYETRYSLVLAEPESGRFHQVRRHLSHIAHPLLGDSDHGRPEHTRLLRERAGLDRLALHAAQLTFRHPIEERELTITAPLPEDLAGPLRALGFDLAAALAPVGLGGLLEASAG